MVGSIGWMATAVLSGGGLSRGTAGRAVASEISVGEPYRAMKELTTRIQRSEYARAPRIDLHEESPSSIISPDIQRNDDPTNLDEKRLQSELVAEICHTYSSLPPLRLPLSTECERMNMLTMLASECSPLDDNIHKAVHHLTARSPPASMEIRLDAVATRQLRKACTPLYEEVLEYILRCDTRLAIPFLVKLREDTLRALQWMRSSSRDDDLLLRLEDLDAYLLRMFELWFSPGMLGKSCARVSELNLMAISIVSPIHVPSLPVSRNG